MKLHLECAVRETRQDCWQHLGQPLTGSCLRAPAAVLISARQCDESTIPQRSSGLPGDQTVNSSNSQDRNNTAPNESDAAALAKHLWSRAWQILGNDRDCIRATIQQCLQVRLTCDAKLWPKSTWLMDNIGVDIIGTEPPERAQVHSIENRNEGKIYHIYLCKILTCKVLTYNCHVPLL